MLDDAAITEAMRVLDLTPGDFQVRSTAELKALKERARKSFRRAALEYHPDRTEDATRHAVFVALGHVMEDIEKMEFDDTRTRRWTFRVRSRSVRRSW